MTVLFPNVKIHFNVTPNRSYLKFELKRKSLQLKRYYFGLIDMVYVLNSLIQQLNPFYSGLFILLCVLVAVYIFCHGQPTIDNILLIKYWSGIDSKDKEHIRPRPTKPCHSKEPKPYTCMHFIYCLTNCYKHQYLNQRYLLQEEYILIKNDTVKRKCVVCYTSMRKHNLKTKWYIQDKKKPE